MGMDCVAVYRRVLPVSVRRVWENVHDWEHLPWVHRGAFLDVQLRTRGAWGWRARVGLAPAARRSEIELELVVEPDRTAYVARTLAGPGEGTEIWTRVEPQGGTSTAVEVCFLVPNVAPERREAVGAALTRLYRRLWDEDEAMMVRRARLLTTRRDARRGPEVVELGPRSSLRSKLPLVVVVGGQSFRVVEVHGELFAHSAVCPHWLGPLEEATLESDAVRCPWHGYRFDLRSGACREAPRYRLPPPPRIEVDSATHEVRLVYEGLAGRSSR
jgi:nitrite reductase/ring-hydroxylating ferredoxin subunit